MGLEVLMEETKSVFGLRYISPEISKSKGVSTGVITLRPYTNGKKFATEKHKRGIKTKTTEIALRELLLKRVKSHRLPLPSEAQIIEAVGRLNDYFISKGVPISSGAVVVRVTTVEESLANLRRVFSELISNQVTALSVSREGCESFFLVARLYSSLTNDGWGGFDEALESLTGKQMASLSGVSVWNNDRELMAGVKGRWSARCEK